MKIFFIFLGFGALAAAAIYFLSKKSTAAATPSAVPQPGTADPFATGYNPNAPIDIGTPPPPPATAPPVNPSVYPYDTYINNRAHVIASRPSSLASARRTAAAPASAFQAVGDPTERQMILSAFSGIGNGIDNATFPLPSKWNDVTTAADIAKILQALQTYKGISNSLLATNWLETNQSLFIIRYWNTNFKELARAFKLRRKIDTLTTFFNNLLRSYEYLNNTLLQAAKNELTAEGYRFTN